MSLDQGGTPRILHCHSKSAGDAAARLCIDVVNGLGDGLEHDFAGTGGGAGALQGLAPRIKARRLVDFPALSGKPGPGRLVNLARAMAGYDLVLTYGWSAMNAVMAHRVFGQSFSLPPLIHHETGFGESGDPEFSQRRNWYRRIALGTADYVVVETSEVGRAASKHWQVQPSRLQIIPRGIEAGDSSREVASDALPGLIKRDGECWIGAIIKSSAGASGVASLIGKLLDMPPNWHMVIFSEGCDVAWVRHEADKLELSHRVHLTDAVIDRSKMLALLDIYVDCTVGMAFPLGAVEAMASGLPVVAAPGSAAAGVVSHINRDLLQSSGLEAALLRLSEDPLACREIGKANRNEAVSTFARETMIESYRALYSKALGHEI